MQKKFKITVIVLLTAWAVLSLTLTDTVAAATRNQALTTPNVTIGSGQTLGTIEILETTPGSITAGLQIMITLPSDSSYMDAPTPGTTDKYVYLPPMAGLTSNALAAGDVIVNNNSTFQTMILDIVHVTNPGNAACLNLLFSVPYFSQVSINGGMGDYSVNIMESTGAVSSGGISNSHAVGGSTSVKILDTPTLTSGSGRSLGVVRLEETLAGALQVGKRSITLVLPNGITWTGADIRLFGGFSSGDVTVSAIDVNESGQSRLLLDVNYRSNGSPGFIEVLGTANIASSVSPGEIQVSVGGPNQGLTTKLLNIARVIEAPSNNTARFVIGSQTCILNGSVISMDIAPYIQNNRTYLPLRYVALALGIGYDGIIWNESNQTITLKKGDKVVQLAIGSTTMLVNGTVSVLEAAPDVKSGYTCLPISSLTRIFGYTAEWQPSSQSVLIK
ncbi:MAG: copper amine oxidase N-terminal domain-containing protein [Syntrophomonas sp.]